MRSTVSWAGAALCCLTVAGCTGRSTSDAVPTTTAASISTTDAPAPTVAATTGGATTTAAAPRPTTTHPAASPSPAPVAPPLADDRYPALLKHIDGHGRTVTVDVVQWFSGTAAAAAKKQDGISPSEAPFDFYVRNANPRLRTLPVAASAPITVNVLASSAGDSPNSSTDVATQWKTFARYDRYLGYTLVWITVRHNVVQRLSEQYLP